jgi:tyrosine-protein kinase Etk/Wzc
MQLSSDPEENNNFINYWNVLIRNKFRIGAVALIALVISYLVTFFLPRTYVSTACILPPQKSVSSGIGIGSSLPDGLNDMARNFMGVITTTNLWIGILKSQTLLDEIISRFNLNDVYAEETLEDSRKVLKNRVVIKRSREDIICISVEDEKPERAAELANAFVDELDKKNKSMVMTDGKRVRVFVEKRLLEAKESLENAEDQFRAFQEKNKAVRLDEQSKAIINAIGEVKGQLIGKEVELQTLRSYQTANHPKVDILQTEVKELKKRLDELEEGKQESLGTSNEDIFIPTIKIPNISVQYARLVRNVKVQETLYEFLTTQFEMARIMEAKDSPTIQVLDVARIPERPIKPRGKFIVLLSTFLAVFVAASISLFIAYIDSMNERQGIKEK